jgi:hypothetical protein
MDSEFFGRCWREDNADVAGLEDLGDRATCVTATTGSAASAVTLPPIARTHAADVSNIEVACGGKEKKKGHPLQPGDGPKS